MPFYVKLLVITALFTACKPRKPDVEIGSGNRKPGDYSKPQTNPAVQQTPAGPQTNTGDTDGGDGDGDISNGGGNNTGGGAYTAASFQGSYEASKPLGKLLSIYFPKGLVMSPGTNGLKIFNGNNAFIETAENIGQPARYENGARLEAKIINNTLYVTRSQGSTVSRFDLTLTSSSDLTVVRTTLVGSTYTENETGYFKKK
jgi:hypothetical protein